MTLSTIIFAGPHERAVQLSARRPETLVYNAATRTFARAGQALTFTRQQTMILLILAARGRLVEWPDIFDHIWGRRADGGPWDFRDSVHVNKTRMRPGLSAMGLRIRTRPWVGLILEETDASR